MTRDRAAVILQSLVRTKSLETSTEAARHRKEVAEELERIYPGIIEYAEAGGLVRDNR